jgi:hypothetical protein
MNPREFENWTVNRWRLEPRVQGLEFEDLSNGEPATPLWKDLALASVVAVLLWALAAAVLA